MKTAEEWRKYAETELPNSMYHFGARNFEDIVRMAQNDALEAAAEFLVGSGWDELAREIRDMKQKAK